MNIRRLLIVAGILVMGLNAWAQGEYPRFEVHADYSLVHFNPSTAFTTSHNLNGGGGGITFNFTKYLGIKMDLQGYGSQANTFVIPAGTTLGRVVTTTPILSTSNGNLFTYLFGPQIKVRASKFEPFGEVLFGGAHSNVYSNLIANLPSGFTNVGIAPNNNGFALLVGGGADIKVAKHIAVRPAEIDYLLTRFHNAFTQATGVTLPNHSNNQNSFRYSAGVVFRFGGGGT